MKQIFLALVALALAHSAHAGNIIRTAAPIQSAAGQGGNPEVPADPGDTPADPSKVSVSNISANPASIVADGKSFSVISSSVIDENGKPVGAGYKVIWWATMGSVSSTTSLTDANGVATMNLTSVTYPSQLTVTAMAGLVEASVNMEFTSDIGGDGALPDSAILMDQTATAWAIPADGVTTTTLTVVLTDAYGTPVAPGLIVPWSTNAGTLSSASTLTDSTGRASVTLTAPASATPVVVTSNGKWTFRITTW